jgi:protein SCO1/2
MMSLGVGNVLPRAALGAMAGLLMTVFVQAKPADHGQRPVGVTLDPLFTLSTHDGRVITREALRGKPFVVMFGYTNCADVCPTSLFEASMLLQGLGQKGDRLAVLFVTVDPERDTPDQLRTYLGSFDSRIVGLTGSREKIAAVTAAFLSPLRRDKGRSTEDGASHSSQLFFMDRYGLLARPVDYTDTGAIGAMATRLLAQ